VLWLLTLIKKVLEKVARSSKFFIVGSTLSAMVCVSTIFIFPSSAQASVTTASFVFTGSTQTWTVPAGVTSITFDISGAQGYNVNYTGCEALGGRVQATMSVTAGDVLTITIGGKSSGQAGGYNGGGMGARVGAGGGGGGATDIRNSSGTKLAVAGGAGGTGNNAGCSPDIGGAGGGLTGGTAPGTGGGTGGTSSAGGIGGTYPGYQTAGNGSLGLGGNGAGGGTNGGGGGGGYYGGGGGSWAGGGGGSSYTAPGIVTSVTHTQGYRAGNGVASISYGPAADITAPSFTSSASFTSPENTVVSTNVAVIKVSESSTISAISGNDLARFNLIFSDTITVFIRFKSPPNFESPEDANSNNIYEITLRAIDSAGNSQTQAITITVTDVTDTSFFISLTLNSSPTYRTESLITAVFSSAAKVSFRVNDTFIAGCRNRLTSGTSPNIIATCTWKPSRRGSMTISAIGVPIDTAISSATSSPLNVSILNRNNRR
jgi:hypothetical protein